MKHTGLHSTRPREKGPYLMMHVFKAWNEIGMVGCKVYEIELPVSGLGLNI